MSHTHCCESSKNSALAQSLDEMDFERGIWSSASNGDLIKVESFLNRGVHPDQRDAAGHTALHYAALSGYTDVCELLLKFGANVDAETRAGRATALHRATTSGKMDVVEMLLKYGSNVTLQDADGRTALHRASLNKHANIVEMLSLRYPELSFIVDNKRKLPKDYTPSS